MEVFHEDLVKTLPFKDAIFCASLQAAGLFYGDLKEKVEAKDTSAEMTLYFLDHGINYNCDNFMKLLTVMENFNSDPVNNLAKEIKKQWSSEPGTSKCSFFLLLYKAIRSCNNTTKKCVLCCYQEMASDNKSGGQIMAAVFSHLMVTSLQIVQHF